MAIWKALYLDGANVGKQSQRKDMPCGFAIISYFPHRFGGVPWKGNLRKQQAVSSLLDVISRVYFGDIKTGTISDDIPLARRKFKEASIPG
ncbi:hypothetical protein RvY_08184-2 [Ramazzottius varieornatus]|uniref:Uncharacterized protein n=1 Tax=Ramazzottius varieornatus TaxID=947166 RepID=A0A1D1V7P3_RAMVA|nr:hypothetical protein RvY_08184-2 [Ramazzottius varieornatus]